MRRHPPPHHHPTPPPPPPATVCPPAPSQCNHMQSHLKRHATVPYTHPHRHLPSLAAAAPAPPTVSGEGDGQGGNGARGGENLMCCELTHTEMQLGKGGMSVKEGRHPSLNARPDHSYMPCTLCMPSLSMSPALCALTPWIGTALSWPLGHSTGTAMMPESCPSPLCYQTPYLVCSGALASGMAPAGATASLLLAHSIVNAALLMPVPLGTYPHASCPPSRHTHTITTHPEEPSLLKQLLPPQLVRRQLTPPIAPAQGRGGRSWARGGVG